MYESITYVVVLIEIQNDILKFIDIAFALLIIKVLVAVCILVELNRDFESISMSKKSYDSCKKKLRVRRSFFYETDYHNDVISKLQISKRMNSKSDYKDYIFVSLKKKNYRQKDFDRDNRRHSFKKLRSVAMTISSAIAFSILITTLIEISIVTISMIIKTMSILKTHHDNILPNHM